MAGYFAAQKQIPEAPACGSRSRAPPAQTRGTKIMSEDLLREGSIRKLWPMDQERFCQHLLRLDKTSRRLRFAHGVSDAFIEDYASRMCEFGSIVFAYLVDGPLPAAPHFRRF